MLQLLMMLLQPSKIKYKTSTDKKLSDKAIDLIDDDPDLTKRKAIDRI